jgi:hypothetical protein
MSRSLAVYGLFLELYPPEHLRQHRAEMLQNFEDLERASSSKAALWLFIGKDLVISLISIKDGQMKSWHTLTAYVIGVFIAWGLIFAVGYHFRGGTPGHPALHVFLGFLLGMLSMYIATRVYPSRRKDPHA